MRDGPGSGARGLIYFQVLTGRIPVRIAAIALALLACASCKLGKRGKGAPDASAPAQMPNGSPLVPGVATASSAAIPAATTAEPPPTVVTPPPPPPDPNALSPTERATLDKAKQQLTEVQGLLSNHGKDKPAESDLKSRCEEIETARAQVEKKNDADVKPFVDASKQTCSFDVPLFSANNALDQMRFSASQASKLLVCKVAERDIAKARSLKPNHFKVRSAETRFHSVCH